MRVLIADTDEGFVKLLETYLWSRGHVTQLATDGLTCSAQLRQFRPDVLLLNQHLLWGGSDGVMAVMRDDPLKRRIPVILVADVPGHFKVSPKERVVVWLRKPYRLSDLVSRIEFDRRAN